LFLTFGVSDIDTLKSFRKAKNFRALKKKILPKHTKERLRQDE
jgi:hypothetical protein